MARAGLRYPERGHALATAAATTFQGRRARVSNRDWRLKVTTSIQTCTYCGRSIIPSEMFYRDVVSGHLNAHRKCLREAPPSMTANGSEKAVTRVGSSIK